MSISFSPTEVIVIANAVSAYYNVILQNWRSDSGDTLFTSVVAITRAFWVFEQKFESYRRGETSMRTVRKYHLLLLQVIGEKEDPAQTTFTFKC